MAIYLENDTCTYFTFLFSHVLNNKAKVFAMFRETFFDRHLPRPFRFCPHFYCRRFKEINSRDIETQGNFEDDKRQDVEYNVQIF